MLGPAIPLAPPHADNGLAGPTPRQELIAAHYLAQGETVGMAARLAGIKPADLQLLVDEPEFQALVDECRRIEAMPKADQEARLERFFRRAVERALADGRVGAIAAAMRLLGLAPRGGRGGREAEGEDAEELAELEREAGKPWGLVPDGEGGWRTPDGREAMPGRELDIVLGKKGPVRCLGTWDLAALAPDFVDNLDDQSPQQTQELNQLAYPRGGAQWDPVTRTLWHWESAKAQEQRLREEAAERERVSTPPWDPAAEVARQGAEAAARAAQPAAPPVAEPAPPAPKREKPPQAKPARQEPEPAGLATRLESLLATGAPSSPEETDLAEAVCALVWPNWPPYQGRLDQIELWRLRDLLARTTVSPQVLARLGGAGTGLARADATGPPPSGACSSHRPSRGPPDPAQVPMTAASLPLPIRRPDGRAAEDLVVPPEPVIR